MTSFGMPKDPERLEQDRLLLEATFGPELYFPEQLPSPAGGDFVARNSLAARVLRQQRHGIEEPGVDPEDMEWLRSMNSLQTFVATAEANPDASVLRTGQIPTMRKIADFFELDIVRREGGLIVLPTSTGKTKIIAELVQATRRRTLFVVPTKELIPQTEAEFRQLEEGHLLDIGHVSGDRKQPGRDLTITTYAYLTRNVKGTSERHIEPTDYPLVVYDEGHELLGTEQRKAIDFFRGHAEQIACTATDSYTEALQVSDLLPHEIVRMNIAEAQTEGMVAPHKNIIVRTPTSMRNVYVASTGEYAQDILGQTINTEERNQAVIDTYKTLFIGKKAVAYCAGIAHAHHLADRMRLNGLRAEAIDGTMNSDQRAEIVEKLRLGSRSGGIDIVTNDKLLGVGFNEPSIEVGLMVAPTLSRLKLMQNCGRVTRLCASIPDKVSWIVQFLDNDYQQPPIIFAEEEASGYAEHGWDGFTFPDEELFSKFHVPGLELIHDPVEVSELAVRHASERILKPPEPPDDWLSVDEAAQHYETTANRIRQAVNRLEADVDKDDDDTFDHAANKGKYQKKIVDKKQKTYLSPEMIARLEKYMADYEVAPSPLWRDSSQIAALYGFSQGWANVNFTRVFIRKDYDESLWGKYVPWSGIGQKRNHFSPEYISAQAGELGLPDYSQEPPELWTSEESLHAEYKDPEVIATIKNRLHNQWMYREAAAGAMLFEEDGEFVTYCSPAYVKAFHKCGHEVPHNMFRHIGSLLHGLEKYGITLEDLEREVTYLLEKQPDTKYGCEKYFDEEGRFSYFCNSRIAAHIREKAIRRKLENRISQETLETVLSDQERQRAGLFSEDDVETMEGQVPDLDEEIIVAIEGLDPMQVLARARQVMERNQELIESIRSRK